MYMHNNHCHRATAHLQLNILLLLRIMRWAGHVARMGEERGCIGSWWGNRREGDHWGDVGVDGWIILGWISRMTLHHGVSIIIIVIIIIIALRSGKKSTNGCLVYVFICIQIKQYIIPYVYLTVGGEETFKP